MYYGLDITLLRECSLRLGSSLNVWVSHHFVVSSDTPIGHIVKLVQHRSENQSYCSCFCDPFSTAEVLDSRLMASGTASRSEDEESLAGQKRSSSQVSGAIPKRRSSSRYRAGCDWVLKFAFMKSAGCHLGQLI